MRRQIVVNGRLWRHYSRWHKDRRCRNTWLSHPNIVGRCNIVHFASYVPDGLPSICRQFPSFPSIPLYSFRSPSFDYFLLWIKSPRQSRRFQTLRNAPVRSEMLRTLCNILWHLNFVTNYVYLIIFLAPKFSQDPTSSGCSGCCVSATILGFVAKTITLLLIFISVANN